MLKLVLLLASLLIVSAYITYTNYPKNEPQQKTDESKNEESIQSELSINLKDTKLNLQETTQVTVELKGTIPTASILQIEYDPQYVEVSDIQNGSVFDDLAISDINNDSGKIHIATILTQDISQISDTSELVDPIICTFNIKALQKGETKIQFNTDETSLGVGGAFLKASYEDGSIQIN